MAIKLYYHKTTFQLITIDDGGESLIVGDDGSKVFEFYFGTGTALVDFVLDTTIPLTYEGRVIFERADGDKTNEVYLTPIAGGFYRYVIGDWVTAVDGDLKITARLKLGAVVTNFGIATIPVEDGVAPDDGSTVSQLQYDAVMGAVNEVIIGVTPIAYDNVASGLTAVDVQGAIDEVDADVDALTLRVTTAETDIDTLETFQTVTVPATYETIADANTVRGRVTAVESGKEDVVDANAHRVRTTALETANMVKAPTWDPVTGVITFPLFDGTYAYIDLPTELIFDTVVYDDVNQQLVFTLKDGTSFNVPIGDILTGMATQQYVADNHYNKTQLNAGQLDTRYYTESEVNNLLQERVNRNLSVYTELLHGNASGNELVYVYDVDDNTFKKIKLSEIYSGSNTATGAFVDTETYTNLVAGSSLFLKVHNLTLQTNGDFRVDLRNVATDEVIFVKFPTITATNTLRVSVNNGTTYYNVVKNGNTMRASVVSGQLVRLQFDGTKFVADIQGDVEIVEEYSDAIESTFGQFNPHDGGVPIVREVQGRTIPALENLVTNGVFGVITGWSVFAGIHSVTDGILGNQADGSQVFSSTYQNITQPNVGDKIYIKVRIRSTNTVATYVGVEYYDGTIFHDVRQATPVQNQWYTLSGVITVTNNSNYAVELKHWYADTTTALDKIMEADYIVPINLTSTFGAGLEPTATEMDAIINALGTNGYISTTSTTHVENSEFKSVGKNLFDKGQYATDYAYKIKVKPSTAYVWSSSTAYKTYDINEVELVSATGTTVTTGSNAYYIAFSGISNVDTFQLEQGTVATTYAPYTSETQKFNHGALRSTIDKTVRDKIRYDNGQYVLDVYVNSADNTALATPLLATEVIDVDGTLIQESTTTLEQLQDIPTTYDIEFSMNTEQTTKTLVQRDKLQQQEIDNLEERATTLEARKTVSHNVIYMSATTWATYDRVDGEVYGVWNESTGVITMYYGTVGA